MKRFDLKICLLLLSVVPLCGSTCTFHSSSNSGKVHFAICVPSSPDCFHPHPHPPAEESEAGPDQDTTSVEGQTRIASNASAGFAPTARAAQASIAQAPARIDLDAFAIEGQPISPGESALGEFVPGLGPFSITVLGALLAGTAYRGLRPRTDATAANVGENRADRSGRP